MLTKCCHRPGLPTPVLCGGCSCRRPRQRGTDEEKRAATREIGHPGMDESPAESRGLGAGTEIALAGWKMPGTGDHRGWWHPLRGRRGPSTIRHLHSLFPNGIFHVSPAWSGRGVGDEATSEFGPCHGSLAGEIVTELLERSTVEGTQTTQSCS